MKKCLFSTAMILSVGLLAVPGFAQSPLPKLQLTKVYPALTLDRPLWMVEAPDDSGRMFIVEQQGRIYIVKKGSDGSNAKVFFNIIDRHPHEDNEEGLLSIAFHPGFKTNHLFYAYYNLHDPRRSVISEFKVSDADPDAADLKSERILFEQPQPFGNHKGGEITFGPDGYLYIVLGDGGDGYDPFGNGQNTAVLLAKMLRIDVNSRGSAPATFGNRRKPLEYGIPKDNPFVNEPEYGGRGARKEIYAYGLRNMWRYSFDRQTGDLWGGDVGQDLWEEIDLIVKGGNYGWSAVEAFHHFKPHAEGAQYNDPVIEYPHNANQRAQSKFPEHTPGNCVTGGYVYRGKKYPALQGVYVYGDYVVGSIWGLRYENGKLGQHDRLLDQKLTIASFAEDGDGEIYLINQDTGIYAISVAP